ncbi:putative E3 ubiquitin-protein ligase RING1a isoform X2 [Humulus lupulus]|uniref:putative E3 ubiquitin-protein ligase RING1a isoform X2 n=1 Tax=Humulus lupulus TaxID=3486 RepID=UPI002B403858|nr:putative E3 ubiquitin-protein ligase RING1a isoform X2 [Humulus lupulus]
MPAQKRCSPGNSHDDDDGDAEPTLHPRPKQSRPEPHPKDDLELLLRRHEEQGLDEETEEEVEEEQVKQQALEDDDGDDDDEDEEDSEGTPSSSSQLKPDFVFVKLPEIRKDVQCPICLGIIKKTRTVMECLHRFCRECIDKSMRMGNNECPACRTHCASRRSLRDDPNYDALIAVLYPDIEKYEEEELAFHEEEKTRNKQIQASIAQIFQRQSEALIKRRTLGKDTPDTYTARTQRIHRNSYSRRRSSRAVELQGSEDNEDGNDNNIGKGESSNDESRIETRHRRRKRQAGTRSSQPSSSVANSDGNTENDLEMNGEKRGISPGIAWNSEILAWGRGGARSNTRHGSAGGFNNKSSRNTRLSKLVDYLRSLEENSDELELHLVLISLDKQSTPSLQQSHLCCRPSLSVKHLCEYVARQTPLKAEEVEFLVVKGQQPLPKDDKTTSDTDSTSLVVVDPCRDDLQVLEAEETLAGVKAHCSPSPGNLILGYRRKGVF